MEVKPILFANDYDHYDDVFGDLDQYEEEEKKKKEEYFENSLKKYGLDYCSVADFFEQYNKKVEELCEHISCPCRHRIAVSNALCDYLDDHEPDEDIYFLWQLCVNDDDHVLFDSEHKFFEDNDIYRWLFRLLDCIDSTKYIYVNQVKALKQYDELISDISFSDNPVGQINLSKVKCAIKPYKIKGVCFDSNLKNITERICRSESLFRLAPLVLYVALMRYTKKMVDTQDFNLNFKNALQRKEYRIDQDNGKNIDNFREHINIFLDLCKVLCTDDESEFLCYAGFSQISNICECTLIIWSYMDWLRPLKIQLENRRFVGFIHGLNDNPCYSDNAVAFMDMMRFEEYDNTLSRNKRMLPKIRGYILEHSEIGDEYLKLIREGCTSKCVSLVNKVISGSGIDINSFDNRMYSLVQAVVMEEIMEYISVKTQYRLIGCMNSFDKLLFTDEKQEDDKYGNEENNT